MAKKRKTFKVSELTDMVNHFLANSFYTDPATRKGMMVVLESVLNETGNYKGYRYLSKQEVPKNQKPGINEECYDKIDWTNVDDIQLFENCDYTRVFYYK